MEKKKILICELFIFVILTLILICIVCYQNKTDKELKNKTALSNMMNACVEILNNEATNILPPKALRIKRGNENKEYSSLFDSNDQLFCGYWELTDLIFEIPETTVLPYEEYLRPRMLAEKKVGDIISIIPGKVSEDEYKTADVIPILGKYREQCSNKNTTLKDLGIKGECYDYFQFDGISFYPISQNKMIILEDSYFYSAERKGDWPYSKNSKYELQVKERYYFDKVEISGTYTMLDGLWKTEKILLDLDGKQRDVNVEDSKEFELLNPPKCKRYITVIPANKNLSNQLLFNNISTKQLGLTGPYYSIIEYVDNKGRLIYAVIIVDKEHIILCKQNIFYLCKRMSELPGVKNWDFGSLF